MAAPVLAVDFGTSNSAAAILEAGHPRRLMIEGRDTADGRDGAETLPTAVFFPARDGRMQIGARATRSLIAGEDGRYMRALKSVLGTPLFHESKLIGGVRQTLSDVVTAFLLRLKAEAEAETGQTFDRVLSGRPVHFHTADPARDTRAEDDLRACYEAAGFRGISFMFEPEAAAMACGGPGQGGGGARTGLIVDIGGGTSDFSVFRTGGRSIEICASHGVRLGGTDFDQALSMTHVMPLLGQGGELRREFGTGLRPIPNAIYADLATWAKIPFLYNRETRRAVADMARLATAPEQIERLSAVLEEETGHQLAFAVEAGKIAANGAGDEVEPDQGHNSGQGPFIDLEFIEHALSADISATSMAIALQKFRDTLHTAARHTLRLADVAEDQVDLVVLVGGSSLMTMVEDVSRRLCPNAAIERSEAFTAVVDGLALATDTVASGR